MTGQAHWLVIVPLLIVGAGIGWVWWRDRVARFRYRHEVRRVRCPVHGKKVTLELVRDKATDQVLGVARCNAFWNEEMVACSKDCLPLFNLSVKKTPAAVTP
jgi:hypothetical protein